MDSSTISNRQSRKDEEVDAETARLLATLWKRRGWIVGCTLVATLLGVIYALVAKPVYYSQAIIALKETGKGNDASRLFSQLGGMGGMVASQLGLGGTNLDKMEVVLRSHELAEKVIRANNLMPILFHEQWNPTDSSWIPMDTSELPTLRDGIRRLREENLTVSLDVKKNMIKIGMSCRDPEIAREFVEFYLSELNRKIRSDVISDAELNRAYLERQLANTSDPVLMEKIHSMIGFEIEKSMLVSSQAFEILDKAVAPIERARPKRKLVVIIAFFAGILLSIAGILVRSAAESARKMIQSDALFVTKSANSPPGSGKASKIGSEKTEH